MARVGRPILLTLVHERAPMKETLTARRLVRRSATAIAILAFFSVFSLGGLCFMDMSAASQHDCCKKTGLPRHRRDAARPPR